MKPRHSPGCPRWLRWEGVRCGLTPRREASGCGGRRISLRYKIAHLPSLHNSTMNIPSSPLRLIFGIVALVRLQQLDEVGGRHIA
ncbi:hypothetical protein Q9966_013952 [Columba livia]|nr:hypothetical protein Q9966_013952 [Columba livia]